MCKDGDNIIREIRKEDLNVIGEGISSKVDEENKTSLSSQEEDMTTTAESDEIDNEILGESNESSSSNGNVRNSTGNRRRKTSIEPVRRSTRDPNLALLEKREVQVLLSKLQTNHPDTVVLKTKQHVNADINSVVLDAIIDALGKNTVCESLYVQNLSRAMLNQQVKHLIDVLKLPRNNIWNLNIGENYEVSVAMWEWFCEELQYTKVTHLYVSEHTIPIELKNKMRYYIRENRKKHNRHCSIKNLHVIQRCTNMWWNPINGVKELKPPPPSQPKATPVAEQPHAMELTPHHTAYWQEGVGKGGEKPWKFKCMCGETCSSYENYRHHPIGRMFECTVCTIWSHVDCVLGAGVSDEDLEEMTDVMCVPCQHRVLRMRRSEPDMEIIEVVETLKREYAPKADLPAGKSSSSSSSSSSSKKNSNTTAKKRTSTGRKPGQRLSKGGSGGGEQEGEEEEGEWKFKCKCGECCSSYENPLYHPSGLRYQCTHCQLWSHVACVLGEKVTAEEVDQMEEVLCYSCQSKLRRRSSRGTSNDELLDLDKMEAVLGSGRKRSRQTLPADTTSDNNTNTEDGANGTSSVIANEEQ